MQTLTSWEEKGWLKGKTDLVLQQLNYKFGELEPEVAAQIHSLEINQLEELSKELLNFGEIGNLISWLRNLEAS